MKDNAKVKFNPLKVFVFSLTISFLMGDFLKLYLPISYIINLFGLIIMLISIYVFYYCVKLFISYGETLPPSTPTYKIIKTGIYSYSRNPIYLAFVCFQLGMFLLFENIMYFFSSMSLFIWIHFKVIKPEEKYLEKKFDILYIRYKENVPRWVIW